MVGYSSDRNADHIEAVVKTEHDQVMYFPPAVKSGNFCEEISVNFLCLGVR